MKIRRSMQPSLNDSSKTRTVYDIYKPVTDFRRRYMFSLEEWVTDVTNHIDCR